MIKKRFLSMLVLLAAVVTGAVAQTTYKVSVKEGTEDATSWQGKAGEGDYQQLPLEGVAAGTAVSVTYSGTKKVKSVKAYDQGKCINDAPVTVPAGETWRVYGTGVATSNQITIADGATVTLDGVTISSDSYCIKCEGSATIILKVGTTNTLTSTSEDYCPALWAGDANTTLTIKGSTGVLNVTSGKYIAGIGGGYKNTNKTCGNITIEGGVITAQGGDQAPGIGSDGASDARCGNITITNGVTRVTAMKGKDATYSIGKGNGTVFYPAYCGTVTIGGTVYWQNNAAVNGGATYLATPTLIYEPSN